MTHRTQELIDEMDPEFWVSYEGLQHRTGTGSSGYQINLKECPFCNDRRYKYYMNAETGVGNCFVCSEGYSYGHLVSKTVELRGHAFDHYLMEVLKAQGWRPKRMTTAAVETEQVKLPLSFPLPTADGQNLVYLEKRGITGEIAKYFHLRFCQQGWWNYQDEKGANRGQRFDNRIIIPVFDLDGTLATFQGRDLTGTSDRKYLFPMKLPGTGRFLYNGQNFLTSKRAVLGEGAFDVAAIKMALDDDTELRDVVAIGTFGKHLSYGAEDGNDQLGRLVALRRRGLQEVTVMWDGEAAALVSALNAAKLISQVGLVARVALLPKGCDPNEVDGSEVRKAFYGAQVYTSNLDIRYRLKNPYK